jgi:hypothetical protein
VLFPFRRVFAVARKRPGTDAPPETAAPDQA